MAIFILLTFSILVLIFALVYRKRNLDGYDSIMQHNKNVQPLFKERSATVKHEHLLEQFKDNVPALKELIALQTQFADELITAAQYEQALDALALKYNPA